MRLKSQHLLLELGQGSLILPLGRYLGLISSIRLLNHVRQREHLSLYLMFRDLQLSHDVRELRIQAHLLPNLVYVARRFRLNYEPRLGLASGVTSHYGMRQRHQAGFVRILLRMLKRLLLLIRSLDFRQLLLNGR